MSSEEQKQPPRATTREHSNSEGKIFAPVSPVDVPCLPPKHDTSPVATKAATPIAPMPGVAASDGATDSKPVKIDTTESNWADSTQPAPDKRTARSSIL